MVAIVVMGTIRGQNSAGGSLSLEGPVAGNEVEILVLPAGVDPGAAEVTRSYIRVDADEFLDFADALRGAIGKGAG